MIYSKYTLQESLTGPRASRPQRSAAFLEGTATAEPWKRYDSSLHFEGWHDDR